MGGWFVRVAVLAPLSIASAIGVWRVYKVVGEQLGAVGGVLGALVAALMLGGLLLIISVLLPAGPREVTRNEGAGTKAQR